MGYVSLPEGNMGGEKPPTGGVVICPACLSRYRCDARFTRREILQNPKVSYVGALS